MSQWMIYTYINIYIVLHCTHLLCALRKCLCGCALNEPMDPLYVCSCLFTLQTSFMAKKTYFPDGSSEGQAHLQV